MKRNNGYIPIAATALILSSVGGIGMADDKAVKEQFDTLDRALKQQTALFNDAQNKLVITQDRIKAFERFRTFMNDGHPASEAKAKEAEKLLRHLELYVGSEGMRLELLDDINNLKNVSEDPVTIEKLEKLYQELKNGNISYGDARKSFTATADAALANNTWRPGAGMTGFGRFGWRKSDGMLCDNLGLENITVTAKEIELGRLSGNDMQVKDGFCQLSFPEITLSMNFKTAAKQYAATVTKISWTEKITSVFSGKNQPEAAIYASVLRPAIRLDVVANQMDVDINNFNPGNSNILVPQGNTIKAFPFSRSTDLDFSKNPALMNLPWIILECGDKNPRCGFVRVVVQFQDKPAKIVSSDKGITIFGNNKVGNIWLFRPDGVRRSPVFLAGKDFRAMTTKINRICGLNLAWPTECRETYKASPDNTGFMVKNDTSFEILKCYSNAVKAMPYSSIPPLLSLALKCGVPVKLSGTPLDWDIPTKYGPFQVLNAKTINYFIPMPPVWRHGLVADKSQKDLADIADRYACYYGKPEHCAIDWAYKGLSSMLMAGDYVAPEKRKELISAAEQSINKALTPEVFWNNYRWRIEPFSKIRYAMDYPRQYYAEHSGDINWGIMLPMYGLDVWSAYTGKDQAIAQNWPLLWSSLCYSKYSQDWAWMSDSISESGEGAAIDCLTASYAGWVGTVRLADTLNRKWEADAARYYLSRTALTHCMRFAYLEYINKEGLWHEDSEGIGSVNGFHEFNAWIHPKKAEPWWGACSLSGFGVQPEVFDAIPLYIGKQRLNAWFKMVKTIYPEWYDGEKVFSSGMIYNGNSGYVTLPFMYLDLCLGEKPDKLKYYLSKAGRNTEGYWHASNVVAEIASASCPVMFTAWPGCIMTGATYDAEKKIVEAKFDNLSNQPAEIIFNCETNKYQVSVNGTAVVPEIIVGKWGNSQKTTVAPGKNNIIINLGKQ